MQCGRGLVLALLLLMQGQCQQGQEHEQESWLLRLAQCEARACALQEPQCGRGFIKEICCNDERSSCYQHDVCDCASKERAKNDSIPLRLKSPELHCVENTALSVQLALVGKESPPADVVFAVELRTPKEEKWTPVKITRNQICGILGLEPESLLQVRVRAVGPSGQRGEPVESEWLETRANSAETPDPPISVQLESLSYGWDEAFANISWTPSHPPTCMYRITWFATYDDRLGEEEVKVHEAPFIASLPNLLLGDVYTVYVRSLNELFELSSDMAELRGGIRTLPCLDALNFNLTICRPGEVQNLTVVQHLPENGTTVKWLNGTMHVTVELTVGWARPRVDPDLYQLLVTSVGYSYDDLDILANVTVPGNTSQVVFSVTVPRLFVLKIWSISEAGEGPTLSEVQTLDLTIKDPQGWPLELVVIVATLVLLTVSFLVLGWCLLRRRLAKGMPDKSSIIGFEENEHGFKAQELRPTRSSPSPAPEVPEGTLIPREQVILGETLGAGCFGTVCKGLLTGLDKTSLEVAVKRLHDDATTEEERQFLLEIDLMRSVGQHPHIVSMIGCCIEGRQRLLIVEYCALGDLQKFLREAWKARDETDSDLSVRYAELAHQGGIEQENRPACLNAFFNGSYGLDFQNTEVRRDLLNLTAADLLSIGRQVAIGMEYLADTRVVHRDLAARNILVCEDRTVKISDFGLSRDVYEQNIYHQSGLTKIPVKWMAIEALQHREYTTQSDVWSFGILLWEIVTFGASPYPSVPNSSLCQLLADGYRMEKPKSCSQELYEVMLMCWREKPSDRPTFSKLKDHLDKMLQCAGAHYMLLE